MSVSIIVPARNEEDSIESCIESALKQTCRAEIIVMDNASADRTYQICARFGEKIRLYRSETNLGLAASLAKAMTLATGEFVLTLHADLRLGCNDYIEKALRHFADPMVAVVTGLPYIDLVRFDKLPFVQKAFMILRRQSEFVRPPEQLEELTFCEERGDVYRRSIVDKIGWFSEGSFESGEDQALSYSIRRMGYKIFRDNTITVDFAYGRSGAGLKANLRKEILYGKTQAWIFRHHGTFVVKAQKLIPQLKYRRMRRITSIPLVTAVLALILASGVARVLGETGLSLVTLGLAILLSSIRFAHYFAIALRVPPKIKPWQIVGTAVLGLISDFMYVGAFFLGLCLSLVNMSKAKA